MLLLILIVTSALYMVILLDQMVKKIFMPTGTIQQLTGRCLIKKNRHLITVLEEKASCEDLYRIRRLY